MRFYQRFHLLFNGDFTTRRIIITAPDAMLPREFDFSEGIRFLYAPSFLPSTFQTRTRPTKSKSLASKVAKGYSNVRRWVEETLPFPFLLLSSLFPISDGIAIGERSKLQTANMCVGRCVLRQERRFIPFQTVVTREVAKMLPVPTSSKELRTAPC